MLSDVFYLSLDSLELQAERIIDPSLRNRPIAIISSPGTSGTIVTLSSEAEQEGLYSGMKVSLAKKKKHRVQFLPYNYSLYHRVNQYVYNTVSCFTPIVEPSEMSGFYMDMKGISTPNNNIKDIGLSVLKKIESRTSLFSVVGISINKLISRIITDVVPVNIHQVCAGAEHHFLAPLDCSVLPSTRQKSVHRMLHFLVADKVSHVQCMSRRIEEFKTLFGVYARQLIDEVNGRDTSLVKPPKLRDHLLEQIILPEDTNDQDVLYAVVQYLAEKIALHLRKRGQMAKKVYAPDDISVISECKKLLTKANNRRVAVRTILLDVSQFKPYAEQKNLFFRSQSRDMAMSVAIEMVRRKHGVDSIKTANVFHALGSC
jgi:DNA polymerase-4